MGLGLMSSLLSLLGALALAVQFGRTRRVRRSYPRASDETLRRQFDLADAVDAEQRAARRERRAAVGGMRTGGGA